MEFRPEDVRAFLKVLASDPEARDTFARVVLPHELLVLAQRVDALAAAQVRTEQNLAGLTEHVVTLTARVDAIAEHLVTLTARVDAIAEQMAILTARVDALTERLDALTARVDAIAEQMVTLTARVDALTERLDALTARVDAIAEQMAILTARVDALTERLDALTARVDALTARVDELTQRVDALTQHVDALTADVSRLTDVVGNLSGRVHELDYWFRPGRFNRIARGARSLDGRERNRIVEAALREGRLSPSEADELYEADLILAGAHRETGSELYLVCEVSPSIDARGVERAARRAGLLQQAGYEALPVVAGARATQAGSEAARQLGVWQLVDGLAILPT